MTKEQYLILLRASLSRQLRGEELEDIVRYYEEYFAEAGPEREQAVMAELGSPERLAEQILHERGQETPLAAGWEKDPAEKYALAVPERRRGGMPMWAFALVLAAAALLMGPVLLGLVLGFGLGGILCIVIGLGFALGALGTTLSLGGIFYQVGGGLAAAAVGIFLLLGALWLVRGSVWLIRWFRNTFVEGGAVDETDH